MRGFYTKRWDENKDLKMDNFAFKKILQGRVQDKSPHGGLGLNQIKSIVFIIIAQVQGIDAATLSQIHVLKKKVNMKNRCRNV